MPEALTSPIVRSLYDRFVNLSAPMLANFAPVVNVRAGDPADKTISPDFPRLSFQLGVGRYITIAPIAYPDLWIVVLRKSFGERRWQKDRVTIKQFAPPDFEQIQNYPNPTLEPPSATDYLQEVENTLAKIQQNLF